MLELNRRHRRRVDERAEVSCGRGLRAHLARLSQPLQDEKGGTRVHGNHR